MIRRFLVVAVVLSAALSDPTYLRAGRPEDQAASQQNHIAWVADALKRMQLVKPGMTRGDLLAVFTTEGGLFTGLQRTFVSRDCPYFKIDVEFKAVGRPDRDAAGRVTPIESNQDIIIKISRPYLQFGVID